MTHHKMKLFLKSYFTGHVTILVLVVRLPGYSPRVPLVP